MSSAVEVVDLDRPQLAVGEGAGHRADAVGLQREPRALFGHREMPSEEHREQVVLGHGHGHDARRVAGGEDVLRDARQPVALLGGREVALERHGADV
jgi:hypothetical protein